MLDFKCSTLYYSRLVFRDLVIENNPTANIKLYIDGELDSDSKAVGGTSGGAYNFSNISTNITLGAVQNWSTGAYQSPASGLIDDFKLYNKSLTSEEIRREYQIDTNTLPPIITTEIINASNTLDAYNRDRYRELEYITPISVLEYAYKQDTGALNLPPIISMTESDPSLVPMINSPSTSLGTIASITLGTIAPSTTTIIEIDQATLALLNPKGYPYSVLSPTSIEIQISGVFYTIFLSNYVTFYQSLEAKNLDSLAKYLSNLEQEVEEISYTKYYINQYYEVDTRGYTTINIPFNSKIVATYKYSNPSTPSTSLRTSTLGTSSNNLSELAYIHNNYQGTPILLTNPLASTTEVVYTNVWGDRVSDLYNVNNTLPTSHGYTGHKYNLNTDLIYAHARYLNTNNKVWLSHDPYSINNFTDAKWLTNPQAQNSYSYGNNDPVNNVDPDGKFAFLIPAAGYALQAAGVALTGYSMYNVGNHYYNGTQSELSALDYLGAIPGVAMAKVGNMIGKMGKVADVAGDISNTTNKSDLLWHEAQGGHTLERHVG